MIYAVVRLGNTEATLTHEGWESANVALSDSLNTAFSIHDVLPHEGHPPMVVVAKLRQMFPGMVIVQSPDLPPNIYQDEEVLY